MEPIAIDPGATVVTPEDNAVRLVEAVLFKSTGGIGLWLHGEEGEALQIVYLRPDFLDALLELEREKVFAGVPA